MNEKDVAKLVEQVLSEYKAAKPQKKLKGVFDTMLSQVSTEVETRWADARRKATASVRTLYHFF